MTALVGGGAASGTCSLAAWPNSIRSSASRFQSGSPGVIGSARVSGSGSVTITCSAGRSPASVRTTPSSIARTGVRSRTRSPSRVRHGEREALVAAGDPVAGQRVERGDVLEDARVEPLAALRARDLDAREHRVGDAGIQPEAADEVGDRAAPAGRGAGDRAARGLETGGVGVDAARLAHVVAHAGVGERRARSRPASRRSSV